jgi:hypothetical protein
MSRRARNFTDGDLGQTVTGEDGPVDRNIASVASPPPAPPLPSDEPLAETLPGFVMSDDPFPPPGEIDGSMPGPVAPPTVLEGEILGPPSAASPFSQVDTISRHQHGAIRYEGRIRIVDAFQYTGQLDKAPRWVDRNWLAWGEHDPLRSIDAGPALRVPLMSGQHAICRIGDYVVQQEVRLAPDQPGDVRTEVWAKDDFRKNFLPIAA